MDYKVASSKLEGTNASGSIYIRGVKGVDGWDSFKWVMEKSNDFSDFDINMITNAYEHALLNMPA